MCPKGGYLPTTSSELENDFAEPHRGFKGVGGRKGRGEGIREGGRREEEEEEKPKRKERERVMEGKEGESERERDGWIDNRDRDREREER